MEFQIDNITIKPLTPELWDDFEQLFGPKGAYGGCWCMWWRISRKESEQNKSEGNRLAMKSIVDSGTVPGVLAYIDNQPCGWCSVAPREHFASLERSRVLKRIDDKQVWSLVCFFIDKKYRGQNLGLKLIAGAVEYVKSQGGKIIEVYPSIIKSENAAPVTTYMGFQKIYEKAGFSVVHQASKAKLIMRYYII